MKIKWKSKKFLAAVGFVIAVATGVAHPELVSQVVVNVGCSVAGGCDE